MNIPRYRYTTVPVGPFCYTGCQRFAGKDYERDHRSQVDLSPMKWSFFSCGHQESELDERPMGI
jgi:hypothetical protein